MVGKRLYDTFIEVVLAQIAQFFPIETGLPHIVIHVWNPLLTNNLTRNFIGWQHREGLLGGWQIFVHDERDALFRAFENLVIFLLLLGLLGRWSLCLHRLVPSFIHNVVNVETLHWGGFVKRQWKCVGTHLRLTRHGWLTQPITDGGESEAKYCQEGGTISFHNA